MRKDVSQTLVNIGMGPGCVVDDVERCGRNAALRDALRHEEEVVTFGQRHRVVDDQSGLRIGRRGPGVLAEETLSDALADDHVGDA